MGSSFTDFQGKGFWARDTDVEVALFVLASEADKLKSRPAWLDEAKERWRIHATAGMHGCVDADLDGFLTTPERVELAIGLAESGRAWLASRGPVLSKELLNSFKTGGPGAYFTHDLKADVFSPMFSALIDLLRGKVGPDWRTVLGAKSKPDTP